MIKFKNILSEAKKYKPNQKISKQEWGKIAKFNKHIDKDGKHYVTQLTGGGTTLVPVVVEGNLAEDFKNNEWEVYVADENRREKIVKVAKSKRAAVILYNKLIKTDKYHEVGMRVIKEGKLNEGKTVTLPNGVKAIIDFKGITFKASKGAPVFLDRDELLKFFRGSTKYLRYT